MNVARDSNGELEIRTKDGSQILLTYNQGLDPSEVPRLDINIILPGFYTGKVDGMCSSTTGTIDSSKVTVQNSENLFLCRDKCASILSHRGQVTANKCAVFNSWTKTKASLSVSVPATASSSSGSMSLTNRTKSSSSSLIIAQPTPKIVEWRTNIQQIIVPKKNITETPENYCYRIFQNLKCGKVNGAFYAQACAKDVKVMEKKFESFVKMYMHSYQRDCAAEISLLRKSPYLKDREVALKVMKEYHVVVEKVTAKVKIHDGAVTKMELPPSSDVLPSGMIVFFFSKYINLCSSLVCHNETIIFSSKSNQLASFFAFKNAPLKLVNSQQKLYHSNQIPVYCFNIRNSDKHA
jgi:hypothetical protein